MMPSLGSLQWLGTSDNVAIVAQPLAFLAWLSGTTDDAMMVALTSNFLAW
jgi:hypothetical protein